MSNALEINDVEFHQHSFQPNGTLANRLPMDALTLTIQDEASLGTGQSTPAVPLPIDWDLFSFNLPLFEVFQQMESMSPSKNWTVCI